MADIVLAFENFAVLDAVDSQVHVFGFNDPVFVSEVKSITIEEKRTRESTATPPDGRVYEIIMEYIAGSNPVHIRVKKMTTQNITGVVDHNSDNVKLERATALPMVALPIFNRNEDITYNVFMPSFGISDGEPLSLFSKRESIRQGQRVAGQLLKDDSANMEFTTAAKVSTAALIDRYDIVGAYEPE